MFRSSLKTHLENIFEIPKVTFDQPSEIFEQDTLFVEIQECQTRATQGYASAKVIGSIFVYSQRDKLPYGFFAKKIAQASASDTDKLFFYDIDVDAINSPARMINISERRCRFIYLYQEQYDPNQGEITSLETEGDFE